jgi:hypothetical protein
MIDSGALTFLFWYVAGLVAAERARSLVRGPARVASTARGSLARAV